jgi:hypothetical protein
MHARIMVSIAQQLASSPKSEKAAIAESAKRAEEIRTGKVI